MKGSSTETLPLVVLTMAVSCLAVAMTLLGRATWLEAVSFVSGAICVWLTVRENVWNFPIGLLNVATFSVVFLQSRLFGDAALQLIYFALGVQGWRLWLYGGSNRSPLRITRATPRELAAIVITVLVATLALWQTLQAIGGSASFFDAATTAVSLASQWLLNRKRLESWVGWILVDLVYIPLYAYKELYLTAVLYAVFLIMAVIGLRLWYSRWHSEREQRSNGLAPLGASLS
jgi:nicotinamide mononucleotide transporter